MTGSYIGRRPPGILFRWPGREERDLTHLNPERWDALVIGAGPAGLMAGLHLGGAGRVLVLEKAPAPARKLLLTGGGHCNLTHADPPRVMLAHYGGQGEFLKPALAALSSRRLVEFFEGAEVACRTEPDGRVRPASGRAGDVRAALLRALGASGVELRRAAPALAVERAPGGGFRVETGAGSHAAGCLLIATGGCSYPRTGSSGDGLGWARALGHRVVEPRPALAPILLADADVRALTGIGLEAAGLSVWRAGRRAWSSAGELLFTHQGLSGPAGLDLSRWVRPGDRLSLDLLAVRAGDRERARRRVHEAFEGAGSRGLKALVRGLVPVERLAALVLARWGQDPTRKAAGMGRATRNRLADLLTDLPLTARGVGGFEVAMATAGGVALEELDPGSLESRLCSGLFFAGEVLDVDGDCGGYNLQAAFSTGFLAARGMRARLGRG
jgi:hypothetical protein